MAPGSIDRSRAAGPGGARPATAWALRAVGSLLLGTLIIGAAFGLAGDANAQYISFGKNKVNYQEFEWKVLESEHIELYFYPEEEHLAHLALAAAERAYEHHRAAFIHEMGEKIPIILYSSHHDFEQTNITPMLIPEGVAGLTELLRGRVLMPFGGSLNDFYDTLQHELVHAFQLSMRKRANRERYRYRSAHTPLWFTEGLAEHWSSDWDADGDMILRDMVISGNLPGLEQFWRYRGTFAMYKLGQSVLGFIEQEYGDDKLPLFYTEAWRARQFNELYPQILGVTEEELSSRWTHSLRERYYPEVEAAEPVWHTAERVSDSGNELKPTPVPAGIEGLENRYVFISPRTGYTNIYLGSLDKEGGEAEVLIKGQRSPDLLSFHGYRSRIDVSAQGMLIFSSHGGERDALVAYDLQTRERVGRWEYRELVGISSPQWDADGRMVVFSGLSREGQSDLYLLDTATGILDQLTDDLFYDGEPTFHPDARRIAFVTDRGDHGREGARNLMLLDLATGERRWLTHGPWWDLAPEFSPDGEAVLFVSTRDGMRDLYTVDLEGCGARRTQVLQAILDPRWLPGGEEILATVYEEGRLRVARIPLEPLEEIAAEHSFALEALPQKEWSWSEDAQVVDAEPGRYKSEFALDVAQGGIAVAPGLGSAEGLQLLLRDLMGNKLLFMHLGNSTISTHDFLDNFSAGVTYIDLSKRINRGLSIYHHAGNYYDALDRPFFQRRAGISGLLSYPLSRFTRVETRLGLAYAEKDEPFENDFRSGVLATHYISWIRDTALWLPTGPIDGERYHLTLGMTMNLHRPGVENVLLLGDARRYLRVGQRSALALRLQGRFSGGPDPQTFLLGGTHSLRGYPWRSLHGTRAALANAELRFPLLHGFLLAPAGVGPMAFPGIQGALFFDAGQAWYDDWPDEVRGSYGISLRMGFGGMLVLRFDLARRTDFSSWPSNVHREFFIGWNY